MFFHMKIYVSALVGIIKVTLRSARCNSKDKKYYFATSTERKKDA